MSDLHQLPQELRDRLLKLGAWHRLNELQAEANELKAFLNEADGNGHADTLTITPRIVRNDADATPKRRSTLSQAGRAAISKAQKARWKKLRADQDAG